MYQFYFLSIMLNLMVGLLLFCGWGAEGGGDGRDFSEEGTLFDDSDDSGVPPKVRSRNVFSVFFGSGSIAEEKLFRLLIGALSVFVAAVKLFAAVHGIPVFGDFFPAVSGLVGGASILVCHYKEGASEPATLPPFVQIVFVDSRKIIGIACLCAAVVHFILPEVLFL